VRVKGAASHTELFVLTAVDTLRSRQRVLLAKLDGAHPPSDGGYATSTGCILYPRTPYHACVHNGFVSHLSSLGSPCAIPEQAKWQLSRLTLNLYIFRLR
jgi:hypothetical protein